MAGPANQIVINAQAATASQASVALSGETAFACSFICVSSSASNSGTLQIQCSNDTFPSIGGTNVPVPVNWINVPGASATATVAAGAIAIVSVPQSSYAGYRWLRVTWTPTSGAGTITVYGFISTY